jgi:hypothetical protein
MAAISPVKSPVMSYTVAAIFDAGVSRREGPKTQMTKK